MMSKEMVYSGTVETPLEDQRASALKHYNEVTSKACEWSGFVAEAIKTYNPLTLKVAMAADEWLRAKECGETADLTFMDIEDIRNIEKAQKRLFAAIEEWRKSWEKESGRALDTSPPPSYPPR